MSNQEIERLGVIERVCRGELTQVNAAKTLGVTTRQIRRLLKGYQQIGPPKIKSYHVSIFMWGFCGDQLPIGVNNTMQNIIKAI